LIFALQPGGTVGEDRILSHYRLDDPHRQVAESKRLLFDGLLDQLSERIGMPTGSILDVGCGHGYFLELARRRGWSAFGVEIVDQAVRRARERVGRSRIFHGRLRDAGLTAGNFDAVTLWDVLFLQADPAAKLAHCFRLLAPGGVIGLRLRNAHFQLGLHRLIEPARRIAPDALRERPDVFHAFCFTPASIQALLVRLGFERIRIVNSPLTFGDPYTISWLSRWVGVAKHMLWLGCRVVDRLSTGKTLIGPSLLVWARKPLPDPNA
jgi:SAM-dependent methyltransferase